MNSFYAFPIAITLALALIRVVRAARKIEQCAYINIEYANALAELREALKEIEL